jgi:hypothetical protein
VALVVGLRRIAPPVHEIPSVVPVAVMRGSKDAAHWLLDAEVKGEDEGCHLQSGPDPRPGVVLPVNARQAPQLMRGHGRAYRFVPSATLACPSLHRDPGGMAAGDLAALSRVYPDLLIVPLQHMDVDLLQRRELLLRVDAHQVVDQLRGASPDG